MIKSNFAVVAAATFSAASVFVLSMCDAQAQSPNLFDPVTFGVNIDQSLINPYDSTTGEGDLRREVSTILYETRRIGARTVRWLSDDVWKQYECGKDPENQATGEIDQAWYEITKILLEEAGKQHMKVVISMMDLASNTFTGLPKDSGARGTVIAEAAKYRDGMKGKDRYPDDHACRNSFQEGYHGTTDLGVMLQNPAIREHMLRRFIAMAMHLKDFPAIGAIELFNEPSANFTQQAIYMRTVKEFEDKIHRANPMLAHVSVYSGTAWVSPDIFSTMEKTGDLASEPFITLHSYLDYSNPGQAARNLDELLGYVKKMVRNKQIAFGEAGHQAHSPLSLQGHAEMVRVLFGEASKQHVGLWVWGNDLSQERGPSPDYKWSFNPLSMAGGSFREFFINTRAENRYTQARSLQIHDDVTGADHSEQVSISRISESDTNANKRLRWELKIGATPFLTFTKDGILTQDSPEGSFLFAHPAETILVSQNPQVHQWAMVSAVSGHWELAVYECHPSQAESSSRTLETPGYLVELSKRDGIRDFSNCPASDRVMSGIL